MFFKKNYERSIPPPPKGRGFLDRGLMNFYSKILTLKSELMWFIRGQP